MNKLDVAAFVGTIVGEQLGRTWLHVDEFDKLLVEELGATSLDMASLQIAFEDKFSELRFADGVTPRAELDVAWEKAKTANDLVQLVIAELARPHE